MFYGFRNSQGVALRLVGVGLLLVGVGLVLNEVLATFASYVDSVASQAPPDIRNAYGLVRHLVPSNMGTCIAIIISMHQAGMVFQWLFYGVNTKAKVLTE